MYNRNVWLGQAEDEDVGPPLEPVEPVYLEHAATVSTEVAARDWMMPVPAAQQIFSIASGVAGGLAGIILAQKFTSAKAISVSATEVLLATGLSFAATFGAIFLIRSFKSYEVAEPE